MLCERFAEHFVPCAEAAKQFLREQLLGEGRLKRSADMLRPTRIIRGRSGPLYHGPAAKR